MANNNIGPAYNVQCFDHGEWGTGTGMAQLRVDEAILVLVREGTSVLPLIVGEHTARVQYQWRKFVEAGHFNQSTLPTTTLDEFARFLREE